MSKRTEPPFFNRPEVATAITDIVARSENLVIYMGSGVSVDDTGASWFKMLTRLASHTSLDIDGVLRFSNDMSAPELATIVFNALEASHGNAARAELSKYLSTIFYEKPAWRNGQFLDSIVYLCHQLKKQGKTVSILTTNYDMYLEIHAAALVSKGAIEGTEFASYFFNNHPSNEAPASGDATASEGTADSASSDLIPSAAEVPVIHLHGYVQEGAVQEDEDLIVFSEKDYYDSEQSVFQIAEKMFSESNVLILGSAISDAPIVRALARTATRAELSRWAIVSRQGYSAAAGAFECDESGDANDVLSRLLDARGEQLHVTYVITDFFSQLAQFPREVARAQRLHSEGDSYEKDPSDYQRRVRTWYTTWIDDKRGQTSEEFQAECHRELRACEKTIRSTLSNESLQAKIEFWVRDPEKSELVLWASSAGTWPDYRIARRAPIVADSEYAAVQVFCSGSSQVIEVGNRSDRWERYFGTPIRYSEEESSIIVGVVTIAIKKHSVGRNVLLKDSRILGQLMTDLIDVGEKIVNNRLVEVIGSGPLWNPESQ